MTTGKQKENRVISYQLLVILNKKKKKYFLLRAHNINDQIILLFYALRIHTEIALFVLDQLYHFLYFNSNPLSLHFTLLNVQFIEH